MEYLRKWRLGVFNVTNAPWNRCIVANYYFLWVFWVVVANQLYLNWLQTRDICQDTRPPNMHRCLNFGGIRSARVR